jgi:hypothetical protein
MHFHLPKPLHGWREFAGEVGIIVIGVLIALGAEQVVENMRQRAELRDATAAMSAELRDDDLPQAFARLIVKRCLNEQLVAIGAIVASGADRGKARAIAIAYVPQYRSWDDQAWKAALSSQAFAHSGPKNMVAWSTPYVYIPLLAQYTSNEQADLPQLRAELTGTGPLSAGEQHDLTQMLARLSYDNRRMTGASSALIGTARQVGVELSPSSRARVIDEARRFYKNGCVGLSPFARVAGADQFLDVPGQF